MRAEHPHRFVQVFVVGADHPAFDGAQVMRVVEGEVRRTTKGAEFLLFERRPVRLAHVLNERDSACFQFIQQLPSEPAETEDVSEEHGTSPRRNLRENLLRVHAEGTRVDVRKHRREPAVEDGRNVRHPRDRRDDDLASLTVQFFQCGERDEVCGRSRIDEHAVLHAQPARPLFLERANVLRLRQDRVILLKERNQGVEVFTADVVLHQRPVKLRWADGRGGAGWWARRFLLDVSLWGRPLACRASLGRPAACPTTFQERSLEFDALRSLSARPEASRTHGLRQDHGPRPQ